MSNSVTTSKRRLGDCLSFIVDNRGKTPPLSEQGIELIEINAIPGNRKSVDFDAVKKHVSEDTYNTWFRKGHPQVGDTLISTVGAIGRVAFVGKQRGCIAQNVIAMRPNVNLVDPGYLFYVLSSDAIQNRLNSLNIGVAQPSLKVPHLLNVELEFPDLPTQRKIAGILSAYDDLIENNLRRIKILEQMAQSLYREWFVHFRFPGHESVKLVDSELGQIPKGWNAPPLGEFVDNKSVHLQTGPFGTQLKASHYAREGTPVINVRNIGFGTLRAEKLEFLPPDKVDELKRHQLQSGDIVFGRKGAVERHLLVGPVEDGWIQGSDCIRLRVVSGPLTPRFLSIGFRETEHQSWMMNQCSGGATMASLNQDILCRIPLAIPPPELITRFDEFSTSAVDQVDVLASKIQTLRRTRDLLLPKLLSGQAVRL